MGLTVACTVQKVAPKGVDVVYDPVGGKSFEEALKVVKWGAQILIIGFASGGIPKVRHMDSDDSLISPKPFLGCLSTISCSGHARMLA